MVEATEVHFERLAARHRDAVYRQLFRMCGNHDDAEDVLVESLVKAYRAMDQLQDDESFRGWLAQIGRRTCGRLKKREAMHPVLNLAQLESQGFEPYAPDQDIAQGMEEKQLKTCIQSAFESLPSHYQDVYRLKDIEGLTVEETATRLGLSVANVKSRLHRSRQMLRNEIDQSICRP